MASSKKIRSLNLYRKFVCRSERRQFEGVINYLNYRFLIVRNQFLGSQGVR
ncbi:hypothetical protein EV03_0391 [Prochlorococcus marinus str. PAC1]|uniref:Uncharacterized protein n=1 Tax=Prochlorococcus marinus str. PAC1 TaxID=59924 RepID=A0A0A2C5S2_PROMR|nr:hypothetical protein EV03_0391 [Prochlorococcus marinus str. PAC1]